MPTRQRKRQRKESIPIDHKEGGKQRPSPPPPAPPSLVRLLKQDKKVLEYFRALQVNLNYDVEKWKKRSHAYKEELEELQRNEKKKSRQIENGVELSTKAGVKQKVSTQIDDSAFDFELSSSSEEDNDSDGRDDGHRQKLLLSAASTKKSTSRSYKFNVDDDEEEEEEDDDEDNAEHLISDKKRKGNSKKTSNATDTTANAETVDTGHPSKNKQVPRRIQIGWNYLRKAEEYLNEIGIVLSTAVVINENIDSDDDIGENRESDKVSSEVNTQNQSLGSNGVRNEENLKDTTRSTISEDDTKEEKTRTYTSYIRRDDNAVLGEIVQVIKEWTKLKINVALPLESSENSNDKDARRDGTQNDAAAEGSMTLKHQYAAFATREILPCFVPLPDHLLRDQDRQKDNGGKIDNELHSPKMPQHPAVRGVEILLKAIAWIDAFGSVLDEIEIDGYNDYETNDTCYDDGIGSYFTQLVQSENSKVNGEMGSSLSLTAERSFSPAIQFATGMKKRHCMIRGFVKSLEGEICESWPVQDRFSRLGNPALRDVRDQSSNDVAKKTRVERRLVLDSKNSLRLAAMVDRCILAKIVTTIYLYRSDPSSAVDFLFRYILTTAPSLQQELYPNYPPVQSLLLIETILETSFPSSIDSSENNHLTLLDYVLENILTLDPCSDNNKTKGIEKDRIYPRPLFMSFQVSLATSAAIYRRRMSHEDTRISEPGLAEEAAYQRILPRLNRGGNHLLSTEATTGGIDYLESSFLSYRESCESLIQYFLEDSTIMNAEMAPISALFKWVLPITIIVQGDDQKLLEVFSEKSEMFLSSKSEIQLLIMEGCTKAIRQMEIRNIDSYRAVISSPITTVVKTFTQSLLTGFIDSIIGKTNSGNQSKTAIRLELSSLSLLIGICHELADGENALRLIQWWSNQKIHDKKENSLLEMSRIFNYWSAFPMARVINLERRKDRMASFLAQAMHAGLWTIRGVVPPERWEVMKQQKSDQEEIFASVEGSILTSHIGTFAIDGSQGSPAQVELELLEWLELSGVPRSLVKRELDSLVKPQWRPNDLRAFDMHASDDPNLLVSITPSEKACALSHIATWKGIASCTFANSFTYTGFARGDPIHDTIGKIGVNRMPPCPVTLVLEDDATLVDRFQDRLDQLLEELPRDFHYCALGYAKPKEAPLLDIPGCRHIKLPTMTWYLTGYLLSQAGAQYLLDRLPVVGPIDAWMGRKMILTSNWENEFGHRMGVGDAPQNGSDYLRPVLSRKEIRLCVRFRAYCASVPLCDQKVRTATATGASASHRDKPFQNWRLRDSDIVYSGNVGAKTRKRKSHRKSF